MLSGVLFVKLVSIGLAVLGMIAWMAASSNPAAPAEVAIFAVVTLVGLAVGLVFFRAVRPGTDSGGPATRVAPGD